MKHFSILLAEDDDIDAKAMVRAFNKNQIMIPVIRAIDGIEALEILRNKHPEKAIVPPYIVIADLNMPRMNGIEMICAIRADYAFKKAIIFVLTTSNNPEDKNAAYDLNVAGYILKTNAGEEFEKVIALLKSYSETMEFPQVEK